MNWLKNNIKKILSVLLIVLVLGVAYFAGDEILSVENEKSVKKSEVEIQKLISPQKENEESTPAENTDAAAENETEQTTENIGIETEFENINKEIEPEENTDAEAEKETINEADKPVENTVGEAENKTINKADTDNIVTSSVGEKAEQSLPESTPPQVEKEKNTDLVCTLSVSCETINSNLDLLDEAKRTVVPPDGIIFEKSNLVFSEGDSVFDVLLREMKNNGIHFEYVKNPMYDGVYIEGIANIYEFDCGSRSGWVYCVNGEFPGYSCSLHKIESGDVIKLLYTCNMGKDVGK